MSKADITLPSVQYRRKATWFSVTTIIVLGACFYLGFNPILIFTEFHFVRDLAGEMLPPNFNLLWQNTSIINSIVQTISMAFLATIYGCLIAFVLAFLSSVNAMPFKAVRLITNTLLSVIRVIPSIVFILVFVIAVGLGAFSGMLALIMITIGTFGKLFIDVIENSENAPAEAIFSVGASRVQVIRYSIIPQIMPAFIANCLYAFDINIRAAIGLGIFGGGGIGFELFMAMQVLHYRDALAIICVIIILVILIEKLSDRLRILILGQGKLR